MKTTIGVTMLAAVLLLGLTGTAAADINVLTSDHAEIIYDDGGVIACRSTVADVCDGGGDPCNATIEIRCGHCLVYSDEVEARCIVPDPA